MGMTKASLDLQIQQETQKAIATLQQNMVYLEKMTKIIDANMRQAYMVMMQDFAQLRVRVNFLMSELKIGMTDQGIIGLEERYKSFADAENIKMKKEFDDAVEARKKFDEDSKKESTTNVVQ